MYINYFGNVFADCIAVTSPEFREQTGEYKRDMTKVFAKCKEASPEGMQTVNLTLLFFQAMAIPAMKIGPGMCIMIAGREVSKERNERGKTVLDRTIYVDWWAARDIDPLGHLEELKVRMEQKSREEEMKLWFAQAMTKCKDTVIGWVTEWFKENLETVKGWFKK